MYKMATQFYKTQQGNYQLDKATGVASQVADIPVGEQLSTGQVLLCLQNYNRDYLALGQKHHRENYHFRRP